MKSLLVYKMCPCCFHALRFHSNNRHNSSTEIIYKTIGTLIKQTDAAAVTASSHLTISMLGQRARGKIQRNNYYHESCGPSLTSKMSSVYLIFTHGTHQNYQKLLSEK